MKTSTSIALGFAILLSASLAAYAQTEPTVHHHVHHNVGPYHTVHHHYVVHGPAMAPGPAPAAATIPAPQAGPFGLALPHIAPYPDGKGDEDGLSEDQDDCNKGCIDGNTPD